IEPPGGVLPQLHSFGPAWDPRCRDDLAHVGECPPVRLRAHPRGQPLLHARLLHPSGPLTVELRSSRVSVGLHPGPARVVRRPDRAVLVPSPYLLRVPHPATPAHRTRPAAPSAPRTAPPSRARPDRASSRTSRGTRRACSQHPRSEERRVGKE